MASPRHPALPESLQSACAICGAPLVLAVSDSTGEIIPLDVRPYQAYMLVIHEGKASAKPLSGYISHAVLCPQAEQINTKKGV